MYKKIEPEKIKFSNISSKDILLALDRLTRFKYPEIKYYRVFSELLSKYLISPKLSKKEIESLDIFTLKKIIEKMWNDSLNVLAPYIQADCDFNKIFIDEIINTYNLSDNMLNFIDLNINITAALSLIANIDNAPINLKRLVYLSKDYSNPKFLREKYSLRFPIEKVLLCEGITEEILVPKFARLVGYDFEKYGIRLISAGGKNQVEKMYCDLKNELKLPIFILLDADAVETANHIKNVLRKSDYIYLIEHGEFEDLFSLNLIKRTINKRFKNICESNIADFKKNLPMTKILSEFFRTHELGDFQKADFAKEISKNLKYKTDLTDEIVKIIELIKAF